MDPKAVWKDRVLRAYSTLRPSEQKVAAFFLEHEDDAEKMNIREVAEAIGVSEPTVLRCVRGLGYKGFKDFKRKMNQDSDSSESFEMMRNMHLRPWDRIEELPLREISTLREALDNVLKSVETETLATAADQIAGARVIDVYGVENSNAAAEDFVVKMTYLGLRCRYYKDPYLQLISAVHLEESDLAIAFSRSGCSIDTVKATMLAHRAGAQTIAVTGRRESVISHYADITLLAGLDEQFAYGNAIFSRVTDMTIVDLLYMSVILSDYDRFSKNLDRSGRVIADRGGRG
ncbi:MAG: MurR/RpiR family transcriptional regulator [Anaerovoracaceae bacterium]|jgi:DNA-binding MurR/RpiR family transcriptional regulator